MNFKIPLYLKELRIEHYIKNVIIFIPFCIFSPDWNIDILCQLLQSFFSFSLIASTVYLFNDLMDYKDDKINPLKKKRPYAHNLLSKSDMRHLLILTLSFSFLLCLGLPYECTIYTLIYLIINIFYTLIIKKLFILDAIFIASGFIIRFLIGCSIIKIHPSYLMVGLIFSISCFFTHIKRRISANYSEQKTLILIKIIVSELILISILYLIIIYNLSNYYSLTVLILNYILANIILLRLLKLSKISQLESPMDILKQDFKIKFYIILFFASLILIGRS